MDAVALSVMWNIVEESEDPVVVALGDGIIFMVVAFGAFQRGSQPDTTGGIHPVNHAFNPKLFLTWIVAKGLHGVTVKTRCHLL